MMGRQLSQQVSRGPTTLMITSNQPYIYRVMAMTVHGDLLVFQGASLLITKLPNAVINYLL